MPVRQGGGVPDLIGPWPGQAPEEHAASPRPPAAAAHSDCAVEGEAAALPELREAISPRPILRLRRRRR